MRTVRRIALAVVIAALLSAVAFGTGWAIRPSDESDGADRPTPGTTIEPQGTPGQQPERPRPTDRADRTDRPRRDHRSAGALHRRVCDGHPGAGASVPRGDVRARGPDHPVRGALLPRQQRVVHRRVRCGVAHRRGLELPIRRRGPESERLRRVVRGARALHAVDRTPSQRTATPAEQAAGVARYCRGIARTSSCRGSSASSKPNGASSIGA